MQTVELPQTNVDALVRSRSIDFNELLTRLSRDELKTICEELGLPSDGREKQPLIERILGAGTPTAVSTVKTASRKLNGKGESREGKASEIIGADLDEKLSREQLERYLWSAADILRGSIDRATTRTTSSGCYFSSACPIALTRSARRS